MALDRGANLDDLLDESEVEILEGETVLRIPKEQIYTEEQVRKKFDPESLIELGKTLERKQEQPIVVYPFDGKGYKIQKGERRWRGAGTNPNVKYLDCIVRETDDPYGQLIENIQREDLTPLEIGMALSKIKIEQGLTQSELAEAVGKSKVYVSKHLTMLEAADFILDALSQGKVKSVEAANALRIAAQEDETKVKNFVESSEVVTVEQAAELKAVVTDKPEKPKPKGKSTSKARNLGILVKMDDRQGLLLAKGSKQGFMSVLFDDGQTEHVEPQKLTLIGYKP